MNEKAINFIKDWIIPAVIAYILAVIINKTLFFTAKIPTGSMYPTIKEGDVTLVTKVYSAKSLERGDIVVFKSHELNMILVKRLVGLPGEKIKIDEKGNVFINNQKYSEPYVKQFGYKSGEFTVPEGCYFFLGDNRRDSLDARYWEQPYISYKDIMGEARILIFPINRIGVLK